MTFTGRRVLLSVRGFVRPRPTAAVGVSADQIRRCRDCSFQLALVPYSTHWNHPWCFVVVTFGFPFPNVGYFPNCHEVLSVVHVLLSLSSGVRLAMVTVIFSSSFVSSPHFALTASFTTSHQLLLSFTVVLHSPPIFPDLSPVVLSVILPPAPLHFLAISANFIISCNY